MNSFFCFGRGFTRKLCRNLITGNKKSGFTFPTQTVKTVAFEMAVRTNFQIKPKKIGSILLLVFLVLYSLTKIILVCPSELGRMSHPEDSSLFCIFPRPCKDGRAMDLLRPQRLWCCWTLWLVEMFGKRWQRRWIMDQLISKVEDFP